jgi:mono/diheme cytochrome c family protein
MRNRQSNNRSGWIVLVVAALVAAAAAAAGAQENDVAELIEKGRSSYLDLCASCHGTDAQGNGIIAPYLKTSPTDLTGIAARNQGSFPFDDVYDIVDGREIPGHGTRSMPVWGPAFLGMDAEADKRVVKEKIVELVYFLKSIQPAMPILPVKLGGASE